MLDDYSSIEGSYKSLIKSIPESLKQSILQSAVQGKLVPQDPNDEPAEELLKRIKAEKQRLIKEKRIKKEKNVSEIYRRDGSWFETIDGKNERCIDEEIPFDIPESWIWSRLGTITNYGKNETIRSEDMENLPIIDLENIEKDTGMLLSVSNKIRSDGVTLHVFSEGNVLYSKLRPYLNKVLVANFDGYSSSEIVVIKGDGSTIPEYLKRCLMAPYFVEYATSRSYGTKMPRLGTEDGRNALIPLPPIGEQRRIVAHLSTLMNLVGNMELIE